MNLKLSRRWTSNCCTQHPCPMAAGSAFGGNGIGSVICAEFRPARSVATDQPGQHLNMEGRIVQGREVAVLFTAGVQKHLPVFNSDFLQRFQAISGKAGANDRHAFNPCFGPISQQCAGVRL